VRDFDERSLPDFSGRLSAVAAREGRGAGDGSCGAAVG